jgi:hypothetical protein
MAHRVYTAIVRAVRTGHLREPFSSADFAATCPGFGKGTYNAFLYKHSEGNQGDASVLFKRVAPGQFRCIRPFRYGL